MKTGTVVREPGSVVEGEVKGPVAAGRATPGAVWVWWDTEVLCAEMPENLEVVE